MATVDRSAGTITYIPLAMLAGVAIVFAAQLLPNPGDWFFRSPAFVGEASLAIYVMHLFVVTALRVAFGTANLHSEALFLTVATALGALVPAIVYWIVMRLGAQIDLPLAKWAGLGPSVRSHYIWPAGPARVAA